MPSTAHCCGTQAKWFQLQKNSSVYVSGLPLDAKEAELVRVFTKCGVIKLDDEAKPRVKVYRCAEDCVPGFDARPDPLA